MWLLIQLAIYIFYLPIRPLHHPRSQRRLPVIPSRRTNGIDDCPLARLLSRGGRRWVRANM